MLGYHVIVFAIATHGGFAQLGPPRLAIGRVVQPRRINRFAEFLSRGAFSEVGCAYSAVASSHLQLSLRIFMAAAKGRLSKRLLN